MKKIVIGLLVLGGSLTALHANSYDPGCSCCCGSFEVGGEWIYLIPTSCDYDFVIKDDRVFDSTSQASVNEVLARLPSGKSKGVGPDYQSGFRVFLGYVIDSSCYDVRVEYTYHHPTDRVKVFGNTTTCGLWPTYMHPRYTRNVNDTGDPSNPAFQTPIYSGIVNGTFVQAQATSSVKFDYDSVDLQFGNRSINICKFAMRVYAGLHFMNLDHRHIAQYNGAMFGNVGNSVVGSFDTNVRWNRNTWGIGPLFGIDARYDIACGFGMGGHFGTALLGGETDGKRFERDQRTWFGTDAPNNVDQTLSVRHEHRDCFFPYLRGSLGVNYLLCCGDCFKALIEVGYEFQSYINTIGQFRFNDQRGTGMANCYSYNLHGVYVSVRATI